MSEKTTEKESLYNHLEKMDVGELLRSINSEDKKVPDAIEKIIPKIEEVVKVIAEKMKAGGRVFYLGAGTSGRLGVVDASELPPTYGLEQGRVIALIAGGDKAIRKAVEHAEDNPEGGWNDLQSYSVTEKDVAVGIAASGTTLYVVGAMKRCNENNIVTIGITCNANSPLSQAVKYPLEIVVGPEFVTGSTRMKAGTAQKLVLNMISTAVMIQLGRIKGNKMVDMQLTNDKLINRGTRFIMEELNVSADVAEKLLKEHGSVRKAINASKGI